MASEESLKPRIPMIGYNDLVAMNQEELTGYVGRRVRREKPPNPPLIPHDAGYTEFLSEVISMSDRRGDGLSQKITTAFGTVIDEVAVKVTQYGFVEEDYNPIASLIYLARVLENHIKKDDRFKNRLTEIADNWLFNDAIDGSVPAGRMIADCLIGFANDGESDMLWQKMWHSDQPKLWALGFSGLSVVSFQATLEELPLLSSRYKDVANRPNDFPLIFWALIWEANKSDERLKLLAKALISVSSPEADSPESQGPNTVTDFLNFLDITTPGSTVAPKKVDYLRQEIAHNRTSRN